MTEMTNPVKVIITVGVSASGKTTWANEYKQNSYNPTYIICRDDIRKSILGGFCGSIWDNWKFTKSNEDLVTTIFNEKLDQHLSENGCTIILADTNLNTKFRNQLISKCRNAGAEVFTLGFPILLEDAIERDKNRVDSVGADVITKQYDRWLEFFTFNN